MIWCKDRSKVCRAMVPQSRDGPPGQWCEAERLKVGLHQPANKKLSALTQRHWCCWEEVAKQRHILCLYKWYMHRSRHNAHKAPPMTVGKIDHSS